MNADKPETKTEPKLLKKLDTEQQYCVVRFSPCGKFLFAGGFDSRIHRWDISTGELAWLPWLSTHHGWVEGLVFGPDGKTLYSADSWGQLCAWTYAQENPKPTWKLEEAHDGWIRSLAVSKDGKLLVTGGRDRAVRVWSAADGKLLHELIDKGGSDLHMTAGSPPRIRIDGELLITEHEKLNPESSQQIVYSILNNEQIARFEQDLAAPAAWRQGVAFGTGGNHRYQSSAAAVVQVANEVAFGAHGESVGRVLDVATGDDAAVGGQPGGADKKVGVRGIGVVGRVGGCRSKFFPVDV